MSKVIGVIGGGIVGLATAFRLQRKYSGAKVIVFEKENQVGLHQSGRNSGVMHCGLYYQPGSLKAKLAVQGIRQMTEFCIKYEIPHEICGKIVVATNSKEVEYLSKLAQRGKSNGLRNLKILTSAEVRKREPFVASEQALLVPEEGIVDYKAVMQKVSEEILQSGGQIYLGTPITDVVDRGNKVTVIAEELEVELDALINCTGLHTDYTYKRFTGSNRSPIRIVPFRGEYFKLTSQAEKLVNHLIYPVPDPEYPFLGVHFTRMMSGIKEVGPNAVFAFKREGYKNSDVSLRDTYDSLTYIGFLNFLKNNFPFAMSEMSSSVFKSVFLKKANKLVPELRASDMEKGSAGVRAQALDPSGNLIMDFRITSFKNQVHVLNAPSPGATASFAIADYIIENYITNIL